MRKKMEHYYNTVLRNVSGEILYHKGNAKMMAYKLKNEITNKAYAVGKVGFGILSKDARTRALDRERLAMDKDFYEKNKSKYLESKYKEEIENMEMTDEERIYSVLLDSNATNLQKRDLEDFLMTNNQDYRSYIDRLGEVYEVNSSEYISKKNGAIEFFKASISNNLTLKKREFMENLDKKETRKFEKIEKSINRKDFMFKHIKERAISIRDYVNEKRAGFETLEQEQRELKAQHENRKEKLRNVAKGMKGRVIDKAEVGYLKGLYAKDSIKDKIETAYIKGMYAKDEVPQMIVNAKDGVKKNVKAMSEKAKSYGVGLKNKLVSKSKSFAKAMHMTKENGQLKTLSDYKKDIENLAHDVKDKSETAYIKGLYAKDKVIDKMETAYIKGLYAKDEVPQMIINAKNDVKKNVKAMSEKAKNFGVGVKNKLVSKSKSFAKAMHMTKENGQLKSLADYKKDMKDLAHNAKDKLETGYIKGMYVKDKVIDEMETTYIKGLYAKDDVVKKVKETSNNIVSKVSDAKTTIGKKAREVQSAVERFEPKKISPFTININKDSYTYKMGRGMKRAITSLGIKGKEFINKGKEVVMNELNRNKEIQREKENGEMGL